MPKITDFNELGQSIWSDYLRRSFITSGELQDLVDQGLSGVTSNPTIFEKAVSGSSDYDSELRKLVEEHKSIKDIYETLALGDISKTADILRPIYDSSNGSDGFVSIEVDPKLANDARGMVDEARRYFRSLNRPNVMIKIPATDAGIPAIEALTAEGINVNVTLIFSLKRYEDSANAYLSGLERLLEAGGDPGRVSSVASFFVSRVDTAVDKALENADQRGEELKGKIGIANSKVAYQKFKEIFSGERWEKLRRKGARVQKVLWASTSTKNPAYPDTLYVDNLAGPDTINTLPPQTIKALLDHGVAKNTLEEGVEEAKQELKLLSELGVDYDRVTNDLEKEGVEKFAKSIESLYNKISQKKERMVSEPYLEPRIKPASFQGEIDSALNKLSSNLVVRRIWNHDYTLWKSNPDEITNRLGWLDSPGIMEENVHRIEKMVEDARTTGYTQVLLLGMGGSSLAPNTFANAFGPAEGYLELSVLDSTKPEVVESKLKGLDLERTLFLVSSKSGKTIETLSLFHFFYNKELELLRSKGKGEDEIRKAVGGHFVVITDPGSPLDKLADELHFRSKFLNDPNIGGRYSALSYFGLVPAGLIGVDLKELLDNALTMAAACESCVDIKDNPGAWLGATLGEFAALGRNKLTLIASEQVGSLCDWIEQLIAESTGKEGRGILPVVGERLTAPENYKDDRLFVYIQLGRDDSFEDQLSKLESAGLPVVRLRMRSPYELGKQFFQWEFATAVAGHIMGINPFDQPDVESAKELARKMVSTYEEKGTLPPEAPALSSQGLRIYGRGIKAKEGTPPGRALLDFVEKSARDSSYISLQAYLQQSPEVDDLLAEIRSLLRNRFKLATTLGYGPRFLHSTGQLHKGDSGAGIIIQLTSEGRGGDLPIPDEAGSKKSSSSSLGFGILTAAEALGDRRTLEDRGRSVVRIDLGQNVDSSLKKLLDSIRSATSPRRREKVTAKPDRKKASSRRRQKR